MSNLTPCPACQKDVSTQAEKCPHCGHGVKKSFSIGRVLGLLVFVLIVIWLFAGVSGIK